MWNAQQQETVSDYARARGMELQEVLQALATSMEKSLHKESGLNPGGRPPPGMAKKKEERAQELHEAGDVAPREQRETASGIDWVIPTALPAREGDATIDQESLPWASLKVDMSRKTSGVSSSYNNGQAAKVGSRPPGRNGAHKKNAARGARLKNLRIIKKLVDLGKILQDFPKTHDLRVCLKSSTFF